MTPTAIAIPPPQVSSAITMAQVEAFAAASGDANPIHLSDQAARAAGLPGAVLHGMIVAGRIEAYLELIRDHLITDLQVRFVRPVPVGSCLTIAARAIDASAGLLHLRIIASIGDGLLVAVGEARLQPASPASG